MATDGERKGGVVKEEYLGGQMGSSGTGGSKAVAAPRLFTSQVHVEHSTPVLTHFSGTLAFPSHALQLVSKTPIFSNRSSDVFD